jgi:MFS family permease
MSDTGPSAAGERASSPGVGDVHDRARLQRRTMIVLVTSQVLGAVGVGSGIAVVSLLAFELAGTASLSGVPPTMMTLGAAAAAVLLARISVHRGRRPGLATGYLVGALGGGLAVLAAVLASFPVHVVASFAIGWASAANLQARYAATDLATPERRGAALSTVVWATTVGAVLGPNLTGPGAEVARWLSLPDLAGPYVLSVAAFLAAAVVQLAFLRPDPLIAAGLAGRRPMPGDDLAESGATVDATGATDPSPPRAGVRSSLRAIRAVPAASAALLSIAAAHATMVGVMVMTPVHMQDHGATLQLVGLTISLHIAGMYALSPVVGWLADRIGRPAVLLLGFGQLGVAVLLAALAVPAGGWLFQLGLVLLGTGWSCCLVAGSTLLTDAVRAEDRPAAQGTSDLVMNLAGGAGGILAGVVLALASFEVLAAGTLVLLAAPLLAVLRLPEADRERRLRAGTSDRAR